MHLVKIRLKRYRIIEVDYTNDKVPHSNYKRYIIQKRFLFWWYDISIGSLKRLTNDFRSYENAYSWLVIHDKIRPKIKVMKKD